MAPLARDVGLSDTSISVDDVSRFQGTEPSAHQAGALVILLTTGMVGDCNGDSVVTVDELIKGVNIALGTSELTICPSLDVNGNDVVTVDELIRAVTNALTGVAT